MATVPLGCHAKGDGVGHGQGGESNGMEDLSDVSPALIKRTRSLVDGFTSSHCCRCAVWGTIDKCKCPNVPKVVSGTRM